MTAGNRATANQLALILWPDESCEIPMKSVRNIAYRLRSLLGYVGLEDLVVYANGIFSFNPEIKVVTDVGLFEDYVTVSRWRTIRKSGIGCMKLPSDCIPGIFCHGCPIIFILSRVLHTIRACISGSPAGI